MDCNRVTMGGLEFDTVRWSIIHVISRLSVASGNFVEYCLCRLSISHTISPAQWLSHLARWGQHSSTEKRAVESATKIPSWRYKSVADNILILAYLIAEAAAKTLNFDSLSAKNDRSRNDLSGRSNTYQFRSASENNECAPVMRLNANFLSSALMMSSI